MSKHLPDVLGCTFGFGAAGSGLGSITGVYVGGQIWKAMLNIDPAVGSSGPFVNLWMNRGIFCGAVFGAIVGFCYALIVRRLRSKGSSAALEISEINRIVS